MKNARALNIMIPAELYNAIKEDADRKNISIASVVRIACSQYIEIQKKD